MDEMDVDEVAGGGATATQSSQKNGSTPEYKELDESELRQVRTELRQMLDDLKNNKDKYTEPGSEYLLTLMRTIRIKFDNLSLKGAESKLLGTVVTMSSELSHIQAQRVSSSGKTFDSQQFMRRVAAFMGNRTENMDWERVGRAVTPRLRRTPTVDFLLGPLEIEVRQRQQRTIHKLNKSADKGVIKTLSEEQIAGARDETTINVQKVFEILREKSPANYFKFVVNPGSFAQTVENIFYVSFLMRDGRARVEIIDSQPVLSLGDEESKTDKSTPTRQLIMDITEKQWREMIKVYNITDTAIPMRAIRH